MWEYLNDWFHIFLVVLAIMGVWQLFRWALLAVAKLLRDIWDTLQGRTIEDD